MARKTGRQRWDAVPDLATPRDRYWLDEYGKHWQAGGRGGWRYKITSRYGPADDEYRFVRVLIRVNRWSYQDGVMLLPLEDIKRRVRQYRKRDQRERAQEAEQQVGAYI